MTIELEPNPDILHDVAALENPPFTVGFAAETRDVEDYARVKLHRKNINMNAANHVGGEDTGFATDSNSLFVLSKDGSTHTLENAPKIEIAEQLIRIVATQYAQEK